MARALGPAVQPWAASLQGWNQAARTHPLDPYLVWAAQTGFRQFVDVNGKLAGDIDFLVELKAPYTPDVPPSWPTIAGAQQAWVPDEYAAPLPGGHARSRFITLRLPAQGQEPAAMVAPVLALIQSPDVVRLQIGFPRPPRRANELGPGNPPPTTPIARPVALPVAPPITPPATPPKVLLALLDDACPFGLPALAAGPLQTRVLALWDQTGGADGASGHPAGMGYGTQLLQADMNRLLTQHRDGARATDEEALYLDSAAHQPALHRRLSHASALLGLMAGAEAGMPSHPRATAACVPPGTDAAEGPAPRRIADAASTAPLVVVQFPREQLGIAGARWMMVRALDGLRYIARASALLSGDATQPIPLVVNISRGSVIGGHDGTALLEQAMDEMMLAHHNLAIVLAAGNAHGTRRDPEGTQPADRLASGRHAHHRLAAQGGTARLGLYLAPNKSIESQLEIWLRRISAQPDGRLQPDDIEVTVTPPAGTGLTPWIGGCPSVTLAPPGADPMVGLFVLPLAAQSTQQSLVSLVVAATQTSRTRVEAPAGLWELRIVNHSAHELQLNAWVERDILPGQARQQQAAQLVPLQGADAVCLGDENTFSNIATGLLGFRAGALQAACDGSGHHALSPYTSEAASPATGPEFSAVADETELRGGIRVSGSTGGATVRMNGTSVAAPQAARWMANRLASGVPLATVRQDLQASVDGDARRGRQAV